MKFFLKPCPAKNEMGFFLKEKSFFFIEMNRTNGYVALKDKFYFHKTRDQPINDQPV
jgi:hypothetical protein